MSSMRFWFPSDASAHAIENTENVLAQQGALIDNLSTLTDGISAMVHYQKRLDNVMTEDFTRSLIKGQKLVGQQLVSLDKHVNEFVQSQTDVVKSMDGLSTTMNDQIPKHVWQSSDRLDKALARINDKMVRLSTQDQAHVGELAGQIKRLEKLLMVSERRSAQRNQQVQSDLQNQFRRESDRLKKTIGDNIASTVHKDVIPFIAKEQRELKKLTRIIDKQYGRRKDDRQDPDADVA